jgi:transcription elongation factor GreA
MTRLRWDRPRTPGGHLPPGNWGRQDALDNEDLEKIAIERQRRSDIAAGKLVAIGSRVVARERESGDTGEFEIARAGGAGLSDESPLGSALLDHRAGETVAVKTPAGVRHWEILEIA